MQCTESPLNFLVAYPVTIPVVSRDASRADQETLGILGDASPPRAHEFPEGRLVPYPRVQVEHLHATSSTLGRHELELPLADLRDLAALLS